MPDQFNATHASLIVTGNISQIDQTGSTVGTTHVEDFFSNCPRIGDGPCGKFQDGWDFFQNPSFSVQPLDSYSLAINFSFFGTPVPFVTESTNVTITLPDSASITPLPAALPLFATGLGALGLLGWRRKRKALAV
jgi:hypothetical protein